MISILLAVAMIIPGGSPRTVTGFATWYDANRHGQTSWYTRQGIKYYGAEGPKLRNAHSFVRAWNGSYKVRVTSRLTGRSIIVDVVDWCSCYGGSTIDLAPAVWNYLGVRLGRGIMPVVVELDWRTEHGK